MATARIKNDFYIFFIYRRIRSVRRHSHIVTINIPFVISRLSRQVFILDLFIICSIDVTCVYSCEIHFIIYVLYKWLPYDSVRHDWYIWLISWQCVCETMVDKDDIGLKALPVIREDRLRLVSEFLVTKRLILTTMPYKVILSSN